MVLKYQIPVIASVIPMSDEMMRCASSGRKRELVGKKWLFPSGYLDGGFFVFPAARLPWVAVMLAKRYHGKPIRCIRVIRARVTIGASSVKSSSFLISTPRREAYLPASGGT